jgi:opacity protein-like surface antigen
MGTVVVAMLLAAGSAEAQRRRPVWKLPFAQPGFYVGTSIGWPAWVNTEGAGDADNDAVVGVSGSLFAGYRFHPRFALEAMVEVTHGGDLDADFDRDDDYTITSVTFAANNKFYFAYGRFQPYGLIGIGAARTNIDPDDESEDDDDRSHFLARAGLGLDMYAARWLAFQLEFSGGVGTRGYGQFSPRLGVVARF